MGGLLPPFPAHTLPFTSSPTSSPLHTRQPYLTFHQTHLPSCLWASAQASPWKALLSATGPTPSTLSSNVTFSWDLPNPHFQRHPTSMLWTLFPSLRCFPPYSSPPTLRHHGTATFLPPPGQGSGSVLFTAGAWHMSCPTSARCLMNAVKRGWAARDFGRSKPGLRGERLILSLRLTPRSQPCSLITRDHRSCSIKATWGWWVQRQLLASGSWCQDTSGWWPGLRGEGTKAREVQT